MEASALQAPAGFAHQRSSIGLAILRLRSDEQLVALLRSGHDEAFQVIHDRYRQRLFAYMRQMLRSRQDAEDALQDVFERAYASLRAGERELALRPWLYRIAHNRCVDQLRRPAPPPLEAMLQIGPPLGDPIFEADRRETLRRLLADVRRLPEQQRSALLMRELGGIPYADVAQALGVTVPAVKSLLVRARIALVQAGEARETDCEDIRAELVLAHEGRVRPNAMARRHLRDCPGCREFRGHLRGVRRQLLALSPAAGPFGVLAKLLGGSGSSGGGAAAAWGGTAASGAAGTGGILASTGALFTGAGHVAALVAATVVTAGGAAAVQQTISANHSSPRAHVHAAPVRAATSFPWASGAGAGSGAGARSSPSGRRSASRPGPASAGTHQPATARMTTVTTAPVRESHPSPGPLAPNELLAPLPDPRPAPSTGSSGPGGPTTTGGSGGGPASSNGSGSGDGGPVTAGSGSGAAGGATASGQAGQASGVATGPTAGAPVADLATSSGSNSSGTATGAPSAST